MRPDMNKLLVERERHGHDRKYREHRHDKQFQPDEVAGRESMKARYDSWNDRKTFNENLNPLRGWLRSCVGKNWDKCYSELREKFDARGVINNHILEHLFQYIEVNAVVDEDGEVLAPPRAYGRDGYAPISTSGADFYVCPKSGMVREVPSVRKSRKTLAAEREAKRRETEAHEFKVIDANTHLRKVNGVWWVLTLKDLPVRAMAYEKPFGIELFKHSFEADNKARTWDQLNDHQRSRFGRLVLSGQPATDVLLKAHVYLQQQARTIGHHRPTYLHRSGPRHEVGAKEVGDRYYDTMKQASYKLLKQHGLVGTADHDEKPLSHRKAAKYRNA